MADSALRAQDIDFVTGLPRLPQALAEISLRTRQHSACEALGIVSSTTSFTLVAVAGGVPITGTNMVRVVP